MRRVWLYGALVVLAASLLVGSGSFSAVSADRGMDVRVAEDEHAYLGIETAETSGIVGTEAFPLLEVTDNFDGDVALQEVSVEDGPATVSETEPIGPSGDIAVTCTAPTDGTEDVTLGITASGESVTVSKTKTVAVSCIRPIHPGDVTFHGCGGVSIDGDPSLLPVEVTLVGANGNSGQVSETTVSIEQDKRSSGSGQIAGLTFADDRKVTNTTVTNPNYVGDDCSGASNGNPASGNSGDPRDVIDTDSEESE